MAPPSGDWPPEEQLPRIPAAFFDVWKKVLKPCHGKVSQGQQGQQLPKQVGQEGKQHLGPWRKKAKPAQGEQPVNLPPWILTGQGQRGFRGVDLTALTRTGCVQVQCNSRACSQCSKFLGVSSTQGFQIGFLAVRPNGPRAKNLQPRARGPLPLNEFPSATLGS